MKKKGRDQGSGRAMRAITTAAVLLWAALRIPALASGQPKLEPAAGDEPGLAELIGGHIPPDVLVMDENGMTVRLAGLVDRPTLLALVYYTCEHVCPQVLAALGQLASGLPLAPGKDYRLIAVSFDPADTPKDAAEAKRNYLKPLGPGFPAGAWSFLTAAPEDIRRLTESLGFRYVKDSHGFTHPSVLVVLGPQAIISSYIHVTRTAYGVGFPVTFQGVATAAALSKAGEGLAGTPSPAPLLFCYPHEPENQPRFYALTAALGAGTLAAMAGLMLFLFLAGRKRVRSSTDA
jgi:protein SCO1/2